MLRSPRDLSLGRHQASRAQRGIGAYLTQGLFFGLLPKLDVVGSSPIARSLEVLEFEGVPVAGIRMGPGDFFLGTVPGPVGALIFAAKSACCLGVRAARSAPTSPESFTPAARGAAPNRSSRRTFAASARSSSSPDPDRSLESRSRAIRRDDP